MSALEKDTLRQAALARRDGLDAGWRAQTSDRLADQAQALTGASWVAGFLPIRSEIDPRPLMAALASQGAHLALPAILDRETIVFRHWRADEPLVEMAMKTLGPGPNAPEVQPDLILMPLAAFDGAGHRIGYGGGFYDRALARMAAMGHRPRLIGLAFDLQEVAHIPAEPHDLPISEVLTESGLRTLRA